MGVWGLDIYDDDLAADIRDEFQGYLDEGMDENEAMNEVILNNEDLLEEEEECGTFILTIGLLAKENDISNSKINKLLKVSCIVVMIIIIIFIIGFQNGTKNMMNNCQNKLKL